jgi:glycosyltransferase involved in cell wall biosynthesis
MADAPHILLVNHVSWLGGAEHSLLDLAAALDPERWRLAAAVPRGPLAERLRALGVEVSELPLHPLGRSWRPGRLGRTLAGLALGVPALRWRLRRGPICLLHANSNAAGLYAILAAGGRPVLWHSRDLRPLGRAGPWLYRRSSVVIANSAAVRDHLLRECRGGDRVRVIHNGIDTDRFAPGRYSGAATRAFLGIAPHSLLVVLVAHLVPWKRHDLFLAAARIVAGEAPDARFVIVGGDPAGANHAWQRQLARLAAEPPLAGRVVFTGAVEDSAPFLEAADVLVHTAAAEPFGRVLVEAMALQRPVVAPDAGGAREIIRRGTDGFLVRPGDPHAFAAAVLRLSADPALRERFGRAGRQHAVECFDRRRMAFEVAALYEQTLAGRLPA